jgi:hypothetical protein
MVKFYIANDGVHKYVAVFDNPSKVVKFGAWGYEDYTQHKDPYRKKLYLTRHRSRENWDDPFSAGALSRWILWNKLTIEDSIKDYIKRFNMYI